MKINFNTVIIKSVLIVIFVGGMTACQRRQPEFVWTSIDVTTASSDHGDAHLLQMFQTNYVLIDTGPRENSDKLVWFLKRNSCSNLNFVVITHGHNDHYGGLIPLINAGITVQRVYFNPSIMSLVTNEPWGCTSEEIESIFSDLKRKNIPICAVVPDQTWRFGKNIVIKTLYAYSATNPLAGLPVDNINDTSTVLMISHGKNKFLFTGDLNRMAGDYFTSHLKSGLCADVLKFPHHGTEGFPNDSFFFAVAPKVVIIPAAENLWLSKRSERARRLTKECKTYVNGINGNIAVVSDGNKITVYSDKCPAALSSAD